MARANAPKTPATKRVPKRASSTGASNEAAAAHSGQDEMPSAEEIKQLQDNIRRFIHSPFMERSIRFLRRLALSPPQVLLLEGGTCEDRLQAAHLWALLLNCPASHSDSRRASIELPCFTCTTCIRLLCHLHRDLFFLDGLASSIKIADVRELRDMLGEPPREAAQRVIILREAQALVEAAANALLKSLEEPRPSTSFLLLTPQRERLLPTLVSRSMVLTLPWRSTQKSATQHLQPWLESLCHFLQSGKGLFAQTSPKNALTPQLAQEILGLCQTALVAALGGSQQQETSTTLQTLFSQAPASRLRMVSECLAECQDSLQYTVNPALVIEWLATRLYLLLR